MRTVFVALSLIALTGCTKRPVRAVYPAIDIAPSCIKRLHMTECDAASPPRCARIFVDYRRGCEQPSVKN